MNEPINTTLQCVVSLTPQALTSYIRRVWVHPRDLPAVLADIQAQQDRQNGIMSTCRVPIPLVCPYAVDWFKPENVLVEGPSGKRRPLTEWPGFATHKDEWQSGELWTYAGHAWVDEDVKPRRTAEEFPK